MPKDFQKIKQGLREIVIKTVNKRDGEKLNRLYNEIDALEATKEIVDKIMLYKEKLSLIPQDQLNNRQKLWLLAYEASELRLIKMGEDSTKKSREQFIESMAILDEFIEQ